MEKISEMIGGFDLGKMPLVRENLSRPQNVEKDDFFFQQIKEHMNKEEQEKIELPNPPIKNKKSDKDSDPLKVSQSDKISQQNQTNAATSSEEKDAPKVQKLSSKDKTLDEISEKVLKTSKILEELNEFAELFPQLSFIHSKFEEGSLEQGKSLQVIEGVLEGFKQSFLDLKTNLEKEGLTSDKLSSFMNELLANLDKPSNLETISEQYSLISSKIEESLKDLFAQANLDKSKEANSNLNSVKLSALEETIKKSLESELPPEQATKSLHPSEELSNEEVLQEDFKIENEPHSQLETLESGTSEGQFGSQEDSSFNSQGAFMSQNQNQGFYKNLSKENFNEFSRLILDQIQEKMTGFIGKKVGHLEFELNPKELGKLNIQISQKGDLVEGKIIVENETVKELLNHRFEDLKQRLGEKGISLSQFDIQTQSEQKQENHQFQKQEFEMIQESKRNQKINQWLNENPDSYIDTTENYFNGERDDSLSILA